MEIDEIKQEPINLDELLNERIELERLEEKSKTDTTPKDFIDLDNENDLFGIRVQKCCKKKKVIVIIDLDFGKESKNTLSRLNHLGIYLKNKINEEAEPWFLYSKGLYDTFKGFYNGIIDSVIIGNYEKIGILEDILKDFSKKGFEENKIIYQRLRNFREYIIDFSKRTGIKIDIGNKRKNEVEYSRDVVDLSGEKADNKSKTDTIRSEEYPINMVNIDEVIEEMEVEEDSYPKQIDIDDLINADKKRPNSHYL